MPLTDGSNSGLLYKKMGSDMSINSVRYRSVDRITLQPERRHGCTGVPGHAFLE
jgi:hypothetical protein